MHKDRNNKKQQEINEYNYDCPLYYTGVLLIADSEEEFFPEEITKLSRDVSMHGLSVIVMAGTAVSVAYTHCYYYYYQTGIILK